MKKARLIFRFTALASVSLLLTMASCKKDPDPTPEPEQEEFDKAVVHYVKLNNDGTETTDTVTVTFDREGTPSPSQIGLEQGLSYRTLISLESQGVSVNDEITEEGTEHQFFFTPSVSGVIDYEYNDADADGHGIGLDGKTTVLSAGNLDLRIVLRHALDKSSPDAQAWNSTTYQTAGGADDLNITFGIAAQ